LPKKKVNFFPNVDTAYKKMLNLVNYNVEVGIEEMLNTVLSVKMLTYILENVESYV
jgi:hypothetical protein